MRSLARILALPLLAAVFATVAVFTWLAPGPLGPLLLPALAGVTTGLALAVGLTVVALRRTAGAVGRLAEAADALSRGGVGRGPRPPAGRAGLRAGGGGGPDRRQHPHHR
jgi:hypothetical protein